MVVLNTTQFLRTASLKIKMIINSTISGQDYVEKSKNKIYTFYVLYLS